MGDRITKVSAREILANRGLVSLQVRVETESGASGTSTPESGVSTGTYEAAFVLDGGERYHGLGARKAAENVNTEIADAVVGMDVTDQAGIDAVMIDLDGTPNKARLGANAIVGVSLAVVAAAARSCRLPLYKYLGGPDALTMPVPIVGIGTGGRYRDPGTSRWLKPSYEFTPWGAGSYSEALYWGWQATEETVKILRQKYPGRFNPAYRGVALAGVIDHDRELLEIMTEAIVRSGHEGQMGIYFDCAADCYYERDIERYVGLFSAGEKTRDDVIALLKDFVEKYPITSLEDPLHERDLEGHALAVKELGIEVVGDDLFTTNPQRLREAIAVGAANSMVLKITQIGTVTEALDACRLAHLNGYNVHPCGSRGDNATIGDFSVGLNAGQVRGGDRNHLIAIENELGSSARWMGRAAYKGWRNSQAC
ncbi:MAG: phosphopyruvate hydratase [Anaerolineae bacterium]|jgi:enolase|nr:phosphopyruvate hydratase [Chloroflexota bacterium]